MKDNKHIQNFEQHQENFNISDVSDSILNQKIKSYLENNLTIEISSETNHTMTTDGSTSTRFNIKLLLNGKEISSDSYHG